MRRRHTVKRSTPKAPRTPAAGAKLSAWKKYKEHLKDHVALVRSLREIRAGLKHSKRSVSKTVKRVVRRAKSRRRRSRR
jgi:hypothetical protein